MPADMSTEKIFEPTVQIQRFKNTVPPQVQLGVFQIWHSGIADFTGALKEYHREQKADADADAGVNMPAVKSLSRAKRREQIEQLRQEAVISYEERKGSAAQQFGDPYCTVFIAHLAPGTTEEDVAAAVRAVLPDVPAAVPPHVALVLRQAKRPYAFVTLGSRAEARQLLSLGRLDVLGRRVVVDVERGRIVKNWLPKRLRKR